MHVRVLIGNVVDIYGWEAAGPHSRTPPSSRVAELCPGLHPASLHNTTNFPMTTYLRVNLFDLEAAR